MECKACGYIYDRDYIKPELSVGDEKFIEINGSFTINRDEYGNPIIKIQLYICPKCSNVVAER